MKYILAASACLATVSACTSVKENAKLSKPNILFLLADDLGYGELGCYGQQIIQTPVLDSLAQQGVRFTGFYAGNAVCSPSRAVLMTGKSAARATIRGNSGYFGDDRWMRVALKKDETTLGEMLQQVGYQTAFIGKWHLDDPNDLSTWAYSRGFGFAVQEQWGSRFGGIRYDEQMHWVNGKADSIYYREEEWNCKDEFRTNIAFQYLDTMNRQKPFFLFMSYRAPHGHEQHIGNKELYGDRSWPEKERVHAAKITLLDRQIGLLLKKLNSMGELDNTLIIFTSDNGPHHEKHDHEFFNSNGSFRGYKRDLYEGGLRVPFIACWKGKIKAGTLSGHVGSFQDLMPTFAEIAGIKIPDQSDGFSILPALFGNPAKQHEHLSWEIQLDGWTRILPDGGFRQSVRMENWKAVRYGVNRPTELYDLSKDPSESHNVAAQYPDITAQMNRIFEDDHTDTEGFPYGGVIQNYRAKEKYMHEQ
ncbi:MAG: sulfatase-like hydrolase/transferase [Mangrovibacterium sp.]